MMTKDMKDLLSAFNEVRNKLSSGRDQDLVDVKKLRAASKADSSGK